MPNYALEPVARAICARAGYDFGGGIAEGSFKETYLATRPDGVTLAVKVLKAGCSPERTDREIDAMKRCSHPNIGSFLELSAIEHASVTYGYLVEAFLAGGTLEDRLRSGLLDDADTLALGDALIGAVVHIAAQGLVHRDFKPANVMFPAPEAPAVVVDFGIVRDLQKTSITKSYLGMGPGTPFFASPEQLNNEKALIDWRTDQFAVGVTLSVARFGFHPYEEPGENVAQVIARVAGRKGPAARFREACAKAKLSVIERMIAAWPAERVRTPEALLSMWQQQREKK
jgi:serine/threonine protein kinase